MTVYMIKTIPNLICFGGGSIKLSTISVLFNFPTITQIFTVFSYPKMTSVKFLRAICSLYILERSVFVCSSSVRVQFFSLFSLYVSFLLYSFCISLLVCSLERSPRKQILYPRTPQRHQN